MTQKTVNRTFAGLAVLLICGLIAGPTYAAAATPDRPADSDITLWVKTAVDQDPRVDTPEVTVATRDGIVTLSGEVDSLAARNYAVQEAKKIRGVLGVIDELVVGPAFRSDEQIEDAITRRLASNPEIESTDLVASSVDGEVTLSGTVSSWAEREEAELLASEVAGVKQVTNNIVTTWTATRTDREIRSDVLASLDRDVYLTDLPVEVAVKDGIVTLTGTVGNAYEHDRAFDDARWVRGVADVHNDLDVDWMENQGVAAKQRIPGDDQLKAAVRDELDQDWRLDPTGINVDVDMGAVTLSGTVFTHEERRIAERDARDVVGVAWVTNRLFAQVDARDDQAIQDDVQFDLDTDYATADLDINAAVHHGVVTLSGEVGTWFERSHAADLAAGVSGVKEVVNHLTVARSSWKLDADLTKSIKSNLTWNWTTWWVHDDIGVTVHNGVATLSGNVNTWAERSEAATVAIDTPGVWKVDNRITVDGYDYPWSEYYYHGPYDYGLQQSK